MKDALDKVFSLQMACKKELKCPTGCKVTPNGSIAKPKKCQGGDEQGSGAAVKPSLGLAKDKDDPSQKQEYDSAVQLAKGLDMNQTRISAANAKNKFDIRGEQLVTQIKMN